MRFLVDTNVILRWIHEESPGHPAAVASVRQLRANGHTLFIAPQNLVEYWCVATRPLPVNGLGLPPSQVAEDVRVLQTFFPMLPDRPSIFREWERLVSMTQVSGRQVHDARLAATMRVHGLSHLLTFNPGDFARYAGIMPVHPRDVVAGVAP